MGKALKVDKEYIDKIMNDLIEIKYITNDKSVINKIDSIRKFIQENVIGSEDKDVTNTIKKIIYNRMIKSINRNPFENKELYNLYENLKSGKVGYESALKEFQEIEKKYNVIKSDEINR